MTGGPHPPAARRDTVRRPTRRVRDDLFAIFPDLPWHPHTARTSQQERVARHVAEARARVAQNIRRQQQATDRVRAVIARRRLR
jgi:hypothetical protein